jgi:flagellar motor component MotA
MYAALFSLCGTMRRIAVCRSIATSVSDAMVGTTKTSVTPYRSSAVAR